MARSILITLLDYDIAARFPTLCSASPTGLKKRGPPTVTNSRAKGAAGERELAEKFRDMGYTSRRTQQFCGAAGDSDVEVSELPGLFVESKRCQRLNIHAVMDQAVSDASPQKKLPVVCHRRNGAEWLLTVRLDDLHQLVRTVKEGGRCE
jgi:hypothetical protein